MTNNKSYKNKNQDYINIAVIMSIFIKTNKKELMMAVESIENQEKTNLDLLIQIDGPVTNNVYDFIVNYEAKGSIANVKISISAECRGLAYSMNNLILKNFNQYEYFARHDSDDYSSSERILNQIKFLEDNKEVDIVGTAFRSFNPSNNKLMHDSFFPTNHAAIAKRFAYSTPIAHATVIFRKSFFLKAGLYNPNHKTLAEDSRLWYAGFYMNCIFANIPEVLYFVSFNSKSYIRRSNIKQIIVIYKIRLRYIFNKKLGIIAFIKASLEFLLRLLLAVFVNLKLNFITSKLIKYYQQKR